MFESLSKLSKFIDFWKRYKKALQWVAKKFPNIRPETLQKFYKMQNQVQEMFDNLNQADKEIVCAKMRRNEL